MNAKTTAKPHYATRDFKDAGTEQEFAKDAEVKADAGAMANYAAAGLVTTEKPTTSDTPAA